MAIIQKEKKMKLEPMYDKIVVKQDEADTTTKRGLVMPESSKEKPKRGKVLSVGPGLLLQNGDLANMPLNVGDEVYFTAYGGTEIEVDGEEYLVMSASEVLAIVR